MANRLSSFTWIKNQNWWTKYIVSWQEKFFCKKNKKLPNRKPLPATKDIFTYTKDVFLQSIICVTSVWSFFEWCLTRIARSFVTNQTLNNFNCSNVVWNDDDAKVCSKPFVNEGVLAARQCSEILKFWTTKKNFHFFLNTSLSWVISQRGGWWLLKLWNVYLNHIFKENYVNVLRMRPVH